MNTQANPSTNRQTAGIEEIYPLSPMQQGMLFHTLLAPDSGAYVVQMAYEIRGQLDRVAFDQAWQILLQRHSILRSAFVWQNLDQPLQVVGQQAVCPITYQDWRQISPTEQQQQLAELLEQQRLQGFALSKAPLMQVTLIQSSETAYQLIWHYHHLLLDGWSMPILLQEFMAIYHGRSLPPAIPYRNYIAWLKTQSKEQAQVFWTEYLQGFTQPNALPYAIADGHECKKYRNEKIEISSIELQALQQFAQTHRVTLNNLIQAAWGLLLSRYDDSQDVVFGMVTSGRPADLAEVDRMVGLFVNTLPLRLQPETSLTVFAYLQQVQQQSQKLNAYEYSSLIEIHTCSSVPRSRPLFETILIFENYPVLDDWQSELQQLEIRALAANEQTNYPLTLYAIANQTLDLELQYQADRFTAQTSHRILAQLRQVLLQMPQVQAIGQIDLLTPSEKQQLNKWNQTQCGIQPLTVVEQFEQQVQQQPEAIALRIPNADSFSYAQLSQLVNQITAALITQGVRTGDRVGVCLSRSVNLIATLLAVLKIGAIYIPLDQNHPQQRLNFILDDAQIQYLISDRDLTNMPELTTQISLAQLLASGYDLVELTPPTLEQTAYILYTSGSTGQPKGVQISHLNLTNCLQSFWHDLQITAADVALATTTIGFDIAGLELFLPLISGAQVVLLESSRNPEIVMQALSDYSVTLMQATPATWHLLLSVGWAGQRNLTVLCGGEAMDLPLAKALIDRCPKVWNVYGPTETTIWSAMQPVTEASLQATTVAIGHPIANTQFHILDRQLQPVPIGASGELYIAGDGVMQGYWQRPELNQQKLIDYQGQRCYATGDRVCLTESGELLYIGRVDEQIKLHGYRIEPGEIAAVMMQHPQIEQAAVCLCDEGEQPYLAAYYTIPSTINALLAAEITIFLTDRLPDYMIPKRLMQLPQMPLNSSGKIDRRSLPSFVAMSRSVELAQTPIQQSVAQIWQNLLKLEQVGLDENFFDLGGHSLLIVRMQGMLKDKLNQEILLVELFRYSTIRTLARYLQPEESADNSPNQAIQQRLTARQDGQQRLQQRRQIARSAVGGAARLEAGIEEES
jgi:surfactin family lipopeptide synthetase C